MKWRKGLNKIEVNKIPNKTVTTRYPFEKSHINTNRLPGKDEQLKQNSFFLSWYLFISYGTCQLTKDSLDVCSSHESLMLRLRIMEMGYKEPLVRLISCPLYLMEYIQWRIDPNSLLQLLHQTSPWPGIIVWQVPSPYICKEMG